MFKTLFKICPDTILRYSVRAGMKYKENGGKSRYNLSINKKNQKSEKITEGKRAE
jgi:hypothetical protein